MNTVPWSDAFTIKVEELLDLEPLEHVLNDGQERSIAIHSMYGTFACRKCKKTWSSTMCCTDLLYKYELDLKQGEIKIQKEYKQDCKKCKIPAKPKFDEEATKRAMKIVIDRIKKIFYGIYPEQGKDSADRHSRARERKRIMKVRIVKLVVLEDVPLVMISDPESGVEGDQTLSQSLMKDQGPNQSNGP